MSYQSFGEHPAVQTGNLHGVVNVEAPLDIDHTSGQERRLTLGQRGSSTIVDDDRPAGPDRESNPPLPRRQATLPRPAEAGDAPRSSKS